MSTHNIFYGILAHKDADALERLIASLEHDKAIFIIHIDKKSNIQDFTKSLKRTNVFVTNTRISCYWGYWSLVQATFALLNKTNTLALRNKIFDYHFVLLSGEHLPLVKPKQLHEYFEMNKGLSVIENWKLPYAQWYQGGEFRFEKFYFRRTKNSKNIKTSFFTRLVKKFKVQKLITPRKIFKNDILYGSTQWITLCETAVSYLLKCKSNVRRQLLFRWSFAPDETYFISMLKRNADLKIKNSQLTMVKFIGTNSNPEYLEKKDLLQLKKPSHLFARKFSQEKNPKAITYLKSLPS